MYTLRYRTLWLTIGWGLVALVVFLLLLPDPPGVIEGSDKLAHLLAYGVLMGWFVQLYPRGRHCHWGLAFIALGGVLELAQGLVGYREMEAYDLLADGVGVGLAWLAGATPFSGVLAALERHWSGV